MKFHKIFIVFFCFANSYSVLLRNGVDLPRDVVNKIYNTLLQCDQKTINSIYFAATDVSNKIDLKSCEQKALSKLSECEIINDQFKLTDEGKAVFLASMDKIVIDPKFRRNMLISPDIYLTSPISWKNYIFPKYWFKK